MGSSRPNKYEKTFTLFDSQAHQNYIGTLKREFAKLEKKSFYYNHKWSTVKKGVSKILIHSQDRSVITGRSDMPGLIRNPLLGLFGNPFLNLLKGKPIKHSYPLDGGEKIDTSVPIEVIHTPGHTDGSVCYYLPTEGILIAGDALSIRKKELFGTSKIFSNDWNQAVASINKLIEFDYNIVYLSHYRPILKNGREKVQKLIEELNKRL